MSNQINPADIHQALIDPFEDRDVEWRVQQSSVSAGGKPWVMVIPYVTNRAIQQRLDEVFGFNGWKNEYKETADKKGYLCGISFKCDGEWVTKWDGSEYSNIEPLKGALSGAMKRAAVQLGIGRYLYNLNEEFATTKVEHNRFDVVEPWQYIYIKPNPKKNQKFQATGAKWLPPVLPDWAQPSFKAEKFLHDIKEAVTIGELQTLYSEALKYAKSFNKPELAKEIVKAKEAKKSAFETSELKQEVDHYSAAEAWLQKSLSDLIYTAANESVLNQQTNKLKQQLLDKFHGKHEQASELVDWLKSSYETRLQTLKGETK